VVRISTFSVKIELHINVLLNCSVDSFKFSKSSQLQWLYATTSK
jgi:hypothetical protein